MVHILDGGGFGIRVPAPPEKPPKIKPGKGGSHKGNQFRNSLQTIEIPASTGQQSYITGFRPKLIMVFGYGSAVDSNLADGFEFPIGAGVGAGSQYCVSSALQDNVSSNAATRMSSVVYEVQHPTHTTASLAKASLVSFSSTGFTLDWTIVPGATRYCFVLALGGSQLDVEILTYDISTSLGNIEVNGGTFTPECVIHIGGAGADLDTGGIYAVTNFGAMTSSAQFAVAFNQADNVATADSARFFRGDRCIHGVASSTGVDYYARYVSLDTDGFTIDVDDATPSGTRHHFAICMRGIDFAVGTTTKPTGAAPATLSISGLGFTPKVGIFLGHSTTAQSTDAGVNFAAMSFGVAVEGVQRSIACVGQDGGTTVQAARRLSTASVYDNISNTTGAVAISGAFDVFGSGTTDIIFNPNNANPDAVGYVLLG